MPVLTCFYMDQIGLNLGQIGHKQPIFKVETQDIGLLYVFENTHHNQCIHKIIWAYTSENLGQVDQSLVNYWAKIEPNWPKRAQMDRSTYFDCREPRLWLIVRFWEYSPLPFWPNIWPNFGPIWSILKHVRTGIMSAVLWRCSWLSKTCSDSKSRVSKVKNSRNIFTLFTPQ